MKANLRTMKKFVLICSSIFFIVSTASAQASVAKPSSIGISFLFYDYESPQRIRSSSLKQVLKDGGWADINEMSPGLALSYFKNLHPKIDFVSTLSGAFVDDAMPQENFTDNSFLVEAIATLQMNMLPKRYMVTPYLVAGVGASKFKSYYGAFMPLGGGVKVNFFDEASFFINARYHVPVSAQTVKRHFVYGLGIAGIISKK